MCYYGLLCLVELFYYGDVIPIDSDTRPARFVSCGGTVYPQVCVGRSGREPLAMTSTSHQVEIKYFSHVNSIVSVYNIGVYLHMCLLMFFVCVCVCVCVCMLVHMCMLLYNVVYR